ncbi:MAG: peptide chain release factor N(5)-glutamine methyltransferase [Treponema sp.]|nr:peptide chain release factor N(5)-glutamine methyltransferase [Treponema sp.]
MTIVEAKRKIAKKIKAVSKSPELDADVLLQALLGKDKTFVLLNRDLELLAEQESRLEEWSDARAQGLPVAYIIQKKEFYGLAFYVNQSVLIPKPDTEILVARAVEIISERITARSGGPLFVCDMCTGSGCMALSVFRTLLDDERIPLEETPFFVLADISAAALEVAQKNARALLSSQELERVKFVQSNLFELVPQKFDIILSNPPYIPHDQARALLQDGRSEPLLALDGDVGAQGDFSGSDDGLEVFRRLALEATKRLNPGGNFLCETGEYNANAAADFLRANGYVNVGIELDLEGQKRVVCARLN